MENDEVDVMTVRRSLRDLKSARELRHAFDGEEALEFLRDSANTTPGLILLDLNMPRMGGLEFLAEVKQDADLRRLPIVVLTTSREEIDLIQCFNRSVAGYMLKPVDYPQFVEVMRTIMTYWTRSEAPTP